MKTFILALAVLMCALYIRAQAPPAPRPTFQIVSNGPNQQVWQALTLVTNATGQVSEQVRAYEAIATGLNHSQNGQWVPSSEQVAVLNNGTAAATNGQHQAFYPGDIYEGNIRLAMPDGQQLQSQPVALSYDDGSNLVIIAVLTNSVGSLDENNKVIYANAFSGLKADILYTYRKDGLEQDIILRQQPPDPESLGLNPATTRLQVLTEFVDSPTPAISTTVFPTQAGYSLADQSLNFGLMKMVPGKAFLMGDETNSDPGFVPVCKQWVQLDGRQFLVEEVPLVALADSLSALPLFSSTESKSYRHMASNQRHFPARQLARTSVPKHTFKAARKLASRGLVLDYNIVLSYSSDFNFRGDTTYLISGDLWLFGTTMIEGGTVLKFDPTNSYADLKVCGPLRCLTEPYRPAIFTVKDDDSVGEIIPGSTGNPTTATNYSAAIGYNYDAEPFDLHDLQVRFLNSGVVDGVIIKTMAWTNVLRNSEFYSTYRPIIGSAGAFGLTNRVDVRNVLIVNANAPFQEWSSEIFSAENVTIWNAQFLFISENSPSTLFLTNSIIVGVTNWEAAPDDNLAINGDSCGIIQCPPASADGIWTVGPTHISFTNCSTNSSAAGIFQFAGEGGFYLATNSPYRGAGSTNIDPALLADLRQKTTWPPTVCSNTSITSPTIFSTPVVRDTNNNPDLGFHYDPLDYSMEQYSVNGSTMTVTNGIVIGTFGSSGLQLINGGQLLSYGTPFAPNMFVNCACVQETPFQGTNSFVADAAGTAAAAFRFTKFFCPANTGYDLYDESGSAFANIDVRNCEFWGGANDLSGASTNGSAVLVNNLFWRSSLYASNISAQASLCLTNNLFWGTVVTLQQPGGGLWSAFNNNFDSTTVAGTLTNGYNAYLNTGGRLSPTNGNNYVSTSSQAYQSGPLGDFYLPLNSALINAGNTNANLIGLYQFTTQTNQAKEANSIVDIGYHYVALNTNGYPMASSGDGIPDYLEDPNGITNRLSAPSIITQPVTQSAELGDDVYFKVVATGFPGPFYQWYFNGAAISGATNATLEIDDVQAGNVGAYYVTVSNAYGQVTSTTASLTSVSAPTFYTVVQGPLTNFVFQGDTTYYVNSTVQLYGATTIEGGTVIKYANHAAAQLVLNGTLICKTAIYRPALLTSRDDNSVGNVVNKSTGTPTNSYQATYLVDVAGLTHFYGNLHIKYANTGILGESQVNVWDSQFVQCGTAVANGSGGAIGLYNVLISQVTNCVSTTGNVTATFLTADRCTSFCPGTYGGASLTNCLLTGVASTNGVSLTAGASLPNGSGIYQIAGGGNYYLATNTFQAQGSANVNPSVLADIENKTTCPPVIYNVPGIYFYTNLNLYPQAQRDTNGSPDIGYHYDPLDYIFGSMYVTNASITINAGTAVGVHETGNYGYSIDISDHAALTCSGLANSLVHIVQYQAVQEQIVSGWGEPWYAAVSQFDGADCSVNAIFTDWSVMAQDFPNINMSDEGPFDFQNCQFHGGQVETYYPTLNFTNCLFERVYCDIEMFDGNNSAFRNNLVFGGTFGYLPVGASDAVIKDNLFDHATIPDWIGGYGLTYDGGNNGYVTNCNMLDPAYDSDLILSASPLYQSGPLGDYYLPTNSPLINAGSTTADNVGLYNFTTQTSQMPETNSVVDIGYHYFSLTNLEPFRTTQMIAIGGERIMSLASSGDLVSWGGNQYGELGDYTHLNSTNSVHILGMTNVARIASGLNHSLAIDSYGALWAWGDNQYGQLGNGTQYSTNVPIQVFGLSSNVIAAAGSRETSIAAKSDGTVWVWGTIEYSPSDLNLATAPTQVIGLTNAIAVASGLGHFVVLLNDGSVWTWGFEEFGQLGDGNLIGSSFAPIRVAGLSNIVAVCAGDNHTLALEASGRTWAWGLNHMGQLGDGGAESSSAMPVLVFSNATLIAAGANHSLSVDTQSNLWAWGDDSVGQLGDAGSASLSVPTQISSVSNLIAISAGSDASAALDAGGDLWEWGISDGDGTNWVWNGTNGYPQLSPLYHDFFGGNLPNLQILGGNNQIGHGGSEFAQPLVFKVTDVDGLALSNAPVSVEIISGDMELRTFSGGNNFKRIRLTTDTNGQVSLIGFADAQPNDTNCLIRVLAASQWQITELDFNETLVPAPTISITSPQSSITYLVRTNEPLTITVDAEAALGESIAEVDYSYGTNEAANTPLGVSSTSPFTFTWTNASWLTNAFVGQYTLAAAAVDNGGGQSVSSPITFTVALDSDGGGLPDYWQIQYFGHIGMDTNSSPDGNGQTLLYDYQNGFDPTDFYDGNRPSMQLLSGNYQVGNNNSFLPQPITIQITDASLGILTNVPVTFSVTNGTALLTETTNDSPSSILSFRTDTNGQASVWVYFPVASSNPPDSTVWVTTPSGTNPVAVFAYEYVPLAHWTFNDTNTWIGESGQLPLLATNIYGVPSWSSNAVVLAQSNNPSLLAYQVTETNGNLNINCQMGSVLFYFKPSWSSADQGGTGPGCFGRLIEIGSFDAGSPENSDVIFSTNGWWSLFLSPDGTQLSFGTSTNGATVINLSATVSFASNTWHQIALLYSPTNSALYMDGQLLVNGAGVGYFPDAGELTNGFRIGSDENGNNQVFGMFDELETFADPLGGIGPPVDTYWFGIPDYQADPNGTLRAWEMSYFGFIGLNPTNSYDDSLTNNLQAFQSGIDPNIISFSISVANNYVTTNQLLGQFTILSGVPASMAVIVDTTNYSAASWEPYGSNILINLGMTPGAHDVWVGLRGRPSYAQQTWHDFSLIWSSNSPEVFITSPANNVSINSSRIDISGNLSSDSIQQVTVDGIPAFISGTNFDAINVPLLPGSNTITALIQDLDGATNVATLNIIGLTNIDGSMDDPVILQPNTTVGSVPLTVTFAVVTNAPGIFESVSLDASGSDSFALTTNTVIPVNYTYQTNGQYFPVATVQTDVGRFSSIGGWHISDSSSTDAPVVINVSTLASNAVFTNIDDPVQVKWFGTNLYVLSKTLASIISFDTNGNVIGQISGLGTGPSGFDLDSQGNVYVAATSSNQIIKYVPTSAGFQIDTNFGAAGIIGNNQGLSSTNLTEFSAPYGVAVSPDGLFLAVSDSGNNRIQIFDLNGNLESEYGCYGTNKGQFCNPKGICYNNKDNLYIVDSGNNRIAVGDSVEILSVNGSLGSSAGQFNNPTTVSAGEDGIFVADTGNNRIVVYSLPKKGEYNLTPSMVLTELSTNLTGPESAAEINDPISPTVFVADTGNNRIVQYCIGRDNVLGTWQNMLSSAGANDIDGVLSCFSVASVENYRQLFLSIGTANVITSLNQIGTLIPAYVKPDTAEYYFTNTVGGVVLTFPVRFDKENGIWKILDF